MLTEIHYSRLIQMIVLTVAVFVGNGKVVAGSKQVLNIPAEPKVYLSTQAEGGGAMESFANCSEIFGFVTLGERLGQKGDVIKAEWVRPDGEIQEIAELTLKEMLFPGQYARFWMRFNIDGGDLIDDIGFYVGDNSPKNREMFDGVWVYKVYLNDSELKMKTFTISFMGTESKHTERGGL